jgi:hypothetical protein
LVDERDNNRQDSLAVATVRRQQIVEGQVASAVVREAVEAHFKASTVAGVARQVLATVVPVAGRARAVEGLVAAAVEREAVVVEVPGVVEEVVPGEAEVGVVGGDKHDWNNGIIKNAGILE